MKKIILILSLFCFSHTNLGNNKKMTIAVFCSANNAIKENLKVITYELGQYLASHNFGLITGGGTLGLMKEISEGYISQADSLDFFINVTLERYKDYHPRTLEKNRVLVDSLNKRLNYFYQHADVFIILPGGFGTLHELVNCLMLNKKMKKRFIVLNFNGCWNHLLKQFSEIVSDNKYALQHFSTLQVATTLAECIAYL